MELYLQFGWGMMKLSLQLIETWGGGTVILSPRDLGDNQLLSFSKDLRKVGGKVLLDPQFYLPRSDYPRLCAHEYWPKDYESNDFWTGPGLKRFLTQVFAFNRELGCQTILVPSPLAATVDDDWLWRQNELIKTAHLLNVGDFRIFATVALSAEAASDEEQIDDLLDAAGKWGVDGVYLVCEHPNGDYLVSEPIWLANTMGLTAGLRLSGMQVIVGYCQHQMLIAASAAATAIASGTWLNVRSFPPEKFQVPEEDETSRRKPWYYCPPALSEFKITTLDIAARLGVRSDLETPASFGSIYADRLFSSPQPSTAEFGITEAFTHYLQCLHSQVSNARLPSYQATFDAHKNALAQAEGILKRLHARGVSGASRDFGDIVEINQGALSILESECGPLLRRHWDSL